MWSCVANGGAYVLGINFPVLFGYAFGWVMFYLAVHGPCGGNYGYFVVLYKLVCGEISHLIDSRRRMAVSVLIVWTSTVFRADFPENNPHKTSHLDKISQKIPQL